MNVVKMLLHIVGITHTAQFTPTTILGSGMRVSTEDPTRVVLDVLPLPSTHSKAISAGPEAKKKQKGTSKTSAVRVEKVQSPFSSIASVSVSTVRLLVVEGL